MDGYFSDLRAARATPAAVTSLSLRGSRAAQRYTDDKLAVLSDMPNLVTCSLDEQQITRLPELRAPQLEQLSLNRNSALRSLAGIERLTTLERLSLSSVDGLDLEVEFARLAELPELTYLQLGGRSFVRMPSTIANLPSLRELVLHDAPELDVVDAFIKLGALPYLQTISLIQPKYFELPDCLAPLVQVRELELMHEMKTLPPSLGAMASLEKLAADGNAFLTIPSTIGKLAKLTTLELARNGLTVLPDALCDCASLETLLLSGNKKLAALPLQIGRLTRLRRLHIAGTKIKQLPDSVVELVNLREFFGPYRHELKVPDAFLELGFETFSGSEALRNRARMRPVETAEVDDLRVDDPDQIPPDFGQPRKLRVSLPDQGPLPQLSNLRLLKELDLEVRELDDALRRLVATRLQSLEIRGEHTALPATIGGLTSLTHLLIDVPITALPDAIGALVELRSLHISRGALAALPDAIGELGALVELSLDGTAIKKLPATIGKLANLATLDLPASLVRLPDELVHCVALAKLTLMETSVSNLALVGKLPALKELWLFQPKRLDAAALFRALADKPLDVLALRGAKLARLPPGVGSLAVARLDLDSTDLIELPKELRNCAALRWIRLSKYGLKQRDAAKDCLPKGRWKKTERRGELSYERTD